VKLYLTSRLLALRASQPDLFAKGDYQPLLASGSRADLVCAFARRYLDDFAIVITSRFPVRFETNSDWGDTALAIPGQRTYCNIFTGRELMIDGDSVDLAMVLGDLPVAVLV